MTDRPVTPDIAVKLIATVKAKVSDNHSDLYKRLAELDVEQGVNRDMWSAKKSLQRALSEAPKVGLTKTLARDLLRLLGYGGINDLSEFIAKYMPDRRLERLTRLHAAFADQEHDAELHRDQTGGYESLRTFGSVIELRRFHARDGAHKDMGLPGRNISIEDTGFAFEPEPTLRFDGIPYNGENNSKWMLHEVTPPDLDDAADGTATLHVQSTDFETVISCDPSIYHVSNGTDMFELNGKSVDNAQRLANRHRFGQLDPKTSAVPYSLTLFYTLILADDKVLFMRRSSDVAWFPNCYEFSGGEQLKPEDMASDTPFAAWMKRAIREEYVTRAMPNAAGNAAVET